MPGVCDRHGIVSRPLVRRGFPHSPFFLFVWRFILRVAGLTEPSTVGGSATLGYGQLFAAQPPGRCPLGAATAPADCVVSRPASGVYRKERTE